MKRLVFGLISISAFTASIVACSSSSSGGSSADACTNVASALISYTEKCSGTLDPAQANAYAARYTQLCQSELALPGTPSGYASQLSACAAAVQASDCNTSSNQLDACNTLPPGTLANGATCEDGIQCQSGSCSAGTTVSPSADGGSSESSNCGTCQPAIADGASCETGGQCVSGDTCVYSSGTGGAFSAICTKKTAPAAIGATCTSSTDCASPNHCAPPTGTSETGVCAAPAAAGVACEESTDCASGLVCALSTGADQRECAAPAAEGATCTEGQCAIGFGCDVTTSKCTKITFAAAGATCDGVVTLCSKGECNTSSGDAGTGGSTCPTIIADGQPCDESDRTASCDEFASCTNGVCVLVPAACN